MKYPKVNKHFAAGYSPDGGKTPLMICAPTMEDLRYGWALMQSRPPLDEKKVRVWGAAKWRKPTAEELK